MLRTRVLTISTVALTTLALGGAATSTVARDGHRHRTTTVTAPLLSQAGVAVGEAKVVTSRGTTWVQVRGKNLTAGWHGVHIHSVGVCQGDFTSSGGHLNLTGAAHPDHEGDLPTMLVRKDGSAVLETLTDRFTASSLLDQDGSAFVVHSGPDNYANIPDRYRAGGADDETKKAGDAGKRVACGVFSGR